MIAESDITLIVPTIPPRTTLLHRAMESARAQSLRPGKALVQMDRDHEGSAVTRNRALEAVETEWVAFLDDDDVLLAHHFATLADHADQTGADMVYSIPIVPEAPNYVRECGYWWAPFDPDLLRRQSYIQSTVLVRTEVLRAGGGFWKPEGSDYDDWGMALGVLDAGGVISHVMEETFIWHHWGPGAPGQPGNTSGLGDRW